MAEGMSMSREEEFLLRCARSHREEEGADAASDLIQQSLDWDLLLQLALRHRLMPALYRELGRVSAEDVPAGFRERLRDYFYLNAARNHLFTEELCRVLQLFESGGIRAVPFKGAALAAALYGDVSQRQFNDLDIMVRREDVLKACALLRGQGYRAEQELSDVDARALLKIECERMFIRKEGRIYLDLHWGLVPRYFPIRPEIENIWQRLTKISLGNCEALSFSVEDQLLILSINAGKEFWPHAGDLCDIARLIKISPPPDWEKLLSEAKRAGAGRMLSVSLWLAQELLGAMVPPKILQGITADKETEALARRVRAELFRKEKVRGRGVSQFLRPAEALDGRGARAKFYLRLGLTPSPEDWRFINWPKPLRFLYYLTRPLRLAKKYALSSKKHVHLA